MATPYGMRFIIDRGGCLTGSVPDGQGDQGWWPFGFGAHCPQSRLKGHRVRLYRKQVRDFCTSDDFCDLVRTRLPFRCLCPTAPECGRASDHVLAARATACARNHRRSVDGWRPRNRPSDLPFLTSPTSFRAVSAVQGWNSSPRRPPHKSPTFAAVSMVNGHRAQVLMVCLAV